MRGEEEDSDWTVRAAVYQHFIETTRGPTCEELATATGLPADDVRASLLRLEAGHHLALFPDRSGVWMAHPFSATATSFPVVTPRGRYWANCAWDALGIPAILGTDAWTETRCAEGGDPVAFGVRDGRAAGDDVLVHLLVPLARAWEDIGYT